MIICIETNGLKVCHTNSLYPNLDWTGEADFVIDDNNPDNQELIAKLFEYAPYFDYVLDDEGNLIDVIENDVVLPEPEIPEPVEDVSYDVLAAAIQEGVNEV
jgi:hypothetical protein